MTAHAQRPDAHLGLPHLPPGPCNTPWQHLLAPNTFPLCCEARLLAAGSFAVCGAQDSPEFQAECPLSSFP